jgi:hypothetical protein
MTRVWSARRRTSRAGTYLAAGADTATPVLTIADDMTVQPAAAGGADACSAIDAAANRADGSFDVTVLAPIDDLDGRMSGSGYLNGGGKRHHFAFTVWRRSTRDAGALAFWVTKGKKLDSFAATINTATFLDEPGASPGRRRQQQPPRDTVILTGTGKWNGRRGYTFEARASDRGEPGRDRDTFSIQIKDAGGTVVAAVNGTLDGGNVESLRVR